MPAYFCFSPSSANVENLDMKEMYYNKSQKDLTEEKIHHLLSENLFMPKNRVSGAKNIAIKSRNILKLKYHFLAQTSVIQSSCCG